MKTFRLTRAYKRDLRRIGRRNYDLSQLANVLNALREAAALPSPGGIISSKANGRAGGSATSSPIGFSSTK